VNLNDNESGDTSSDGGQVQPSSTSLPPEIGKHFTNFAIPMMLL